MSSPSSSHMPAMKVGGRRLSVSNKHKRNNSTTKDSAKPTEPATPPDYPRPTEEEGAAAEDEDQQHETEQAKRERNKRAEFSPEHNIKRDKWTDGAPRKNNTHGGAGRISQPAGKAFPA